jgi:hypothetical protein
MLPPILAQIHQDLKAKGSEKRTRNQNALLAELEKLNAALNESTLHKSIRDSLSETRIVGGADASCPTCGRAF